MSNKKKAWIIVSVIPAVLILLIAAFILFLSMDDIILSIDAQKAVSKAKSEAAVYIESKYGEADRVLSAEALYSGGGFMEGTKRHVSAVKVNFKGYTVLAANEVLCDDRQYEEICSAVLERYFDGTDLGSSFTGSAYVLFSDITGIMDSSSCTSAFFDGDIDKFIAENKPGLSAEITYEGYPDKQDEYRQLLNEKFDQLENDFDNESLRATILVKNPGLDLPEMPHEPAVKGGKIQNIPQYDEYMELIACGYIKDDKMQVFQTLFYEFDDYTAVSDNSRPILSKQEITFESVDLSDNTTVYRGRYKQDYRKDENVLTTRNEGWRISLSERRVYDIFLRLDREHYGITDTTIPLIVADLTRRSEEDFDIWETRRYYLTVGYGNYTYVDTNFDDWYYLDDDYLYLKISAFQSDLNGDWILTFSDSELPE